MMKKVALGIVFFITLLGMLSCSSGGAGGGGGEKPIDEDPDMPKPRVVIQALGEDNNRIVYAGRSLYVEVEVAASVEIEQFSMSIKGAKGTIVEESYDEYKGKKSFLSKKYYEIKENISGGEYTYLITVKDKAGKETSAKGRFNVKNIKEKLKPEIQEGELPEVEQTVIIGETLSLNGTVLDNKGLKNLLIALLRFDAGVKDDAVTTKNSIVMLNLNSFDRPDSHFFDASIKLGADKDNNNPARSLSSSDWKTGEYYILIKCTDIDGNITYSRHHPIVIMERSGSN